MEILVIWLLFSLPIGFLAHAYGRSGFAWFVFSLLMSPIIMGIALLIAGKAKDREHKPCPACAEPIRIQAVKCRFCGADLSTPASADAGPSPGESVADWLRRHRTDPPS